MTVREFMSMWVDDISIKVYQRPIKKIDKCDLVITGYEKSDSCLASVIAIKLENEREQTNG